MMPTWKNAQLERTVFTMLRGKNIPQGGGNVKNINNNKNNSKNKYLISIIRLSERTKDTSIYFVTRQCI
jgi:hypothetical protein